MAWAPGRTGPRAARSQTWCQGRLAEGHGDPQQAACPRYKIDRPFSIMERTRCMADAIGVFYPARFLAVSSRLQQSRCSSSHQITDAAVDAIHRIWVGLLCLGTRLLAAIAASMPRQCNPCGIAS